MWEGGTARSGDKGNQRVGWIRDNLLAILNREVGRVIGGLTQPLTKTPVRPSQTQALETAITSCANPRHMMDDAFSLATGYPMATGWGEGPCGSLVNDRMEHSGMRWSIRGAQAVLNLRAVTKNDDREHFWHHTIDAEKTRLYGNSSPGNVYPLAAYPFL